MSTIGADGMSADGSVERTVTPLDVTIERGTTGVKVDFGVHLRTIDMLPGDARQLATGLMTLADHIESECVAEVKDWLSVPLDLDIIMHLKMLVWGAASPQALPAGFVGSMQVLMSCVNDVAVLYAAMSEIEAATEGTDVLASLMSGSGARKRASEFLRWIALLPTVPPRLAP